MLYSNFEKYLDESDIEENDYLLLGTIQIDFYQFDRKEAEQQKEFEFDGSSYTLKYDHSSYIYENYLLIDYYSGDNVCIGIDSKTEKIVFFENSNINKPSYVKEMYEAGAPIFDQETQTKKATSIFSKYIDCFLEYTHSLTEKVWINPIDREIDELYRLRKYYYTRVVNEFVTSDTILLCITAFGDVQKMDIRNVGSIDESVVPTEDDVSIIMDEIDKLIDTMREKGFECYDWRINSLYDDTRFVRLDSEKYALVLKVHYLPRYSEEVFTEYGRNLGEFIVYFK